MERPAKIIATLGPATDAPEILAELFDAGRVVARIYFSHGTPREHAAHLRLLRRMALYWGIRPVLIPRVPSTQPRLDGGALPLCEMGPASQGHGLAVITATPSAHGGPS